MKPRSFFLEIAALFILSFNSFAQIVEPEYARKIALNTFSELNKGSGEATITGDSVIYDDRNQPLLYIFTESKGGFMIISADSRTYPLLGWSDSGSSSPENSGPPPALIGMIENWKEQIRFCRTHNLSPGIGVSGLWARLEKGEFTGLNGTKDIAPLLITKWSQGCGYNAMCPVDPAGPCGRALTGCVATAMAQVIRYREHPAAGIGSKCYNSSRYGELCADFSSGTYDYASMPNTGSNAEVAELMYHCGVSVSMNYGPSASSASSGSVATAMRTYFDYTNGLILSKTAYPETNWANLLKYELDNFRPIYYSGYGTTGHAFVLDGYEATDHFHVNWGWGGSYNGYFYLSSLHPGSMDFTSGQQAIVGMIPAAEFTGLNFSSAIDLGCRTPVAGNLADGNANVNYYKNIYPAVVGKELVYKFTTSFPGRITIRITNQTSPVYTFLLNHAAKDSVLTYGLNGVVIDNTLPGTYYVAVESNDFSEPGFTIEAICPTMDPDLDITEASVNPRYIESFQTNVRFSSTIENIGRSTAASCELEYYLSSDEVLDESTDKFLGKKTIPSLLPDQRTTLASVLTMPEITVPGSYFILFSADRANLIPETDDFNIYKVPVSVPEPGLLNCSASVALADGVWHYGNTMQDGINNVESYSEASDMNGPEVVHSFTSSYDGIVKIAFVDKSPGILSSILLAVCNEKTVLQSLRLHDLTDTLGTGEFFAVAGVSYFIVVDGYAGASGEYGLRVDLPGKCPEALIECFGKTDLCEGESWPYLRVPMDHSKYQWYINGAEISGATYYYYNVRRAGTYVVAITENDCKSISPPVTVRSDLRPDTALITASGNATFCPGGSLLIKLDNEISYPVNWAVNDIFVQGATGPSYSAKATGSYSLYTINGACRVKSQNSIDVTVFPSPADLNDEIPFPSEKVRFYERFDSGGDYEGGTITQKARMIGWDYEPVDDRFGNFWKARYLMGEDEYMYWSEYDTISDDFIIALWFRTSTTEGGVIAGFYDAPYNPLKSEAVMYMSDNGKVHFRLSNGTSPEEISTSSSYNDGKWHYAMISHDGAMTLEIDDGAEKIISEGPFIKEIFTGSWTFGGTFLPAGVEDMPHSKYFRGAVDDILCLDEANRFTTPYMIRQPRQQIFTSELMPECVPATVSFTMPFSQKGVEYKVWDRLRSLWAPATATSDGGSVQFGGADLVVGRNEFQVVAMSLATGCEIVLDTVFVAEVESVCTAVQQETVEECLKVYPVPAKEKVRFESSKIITELKIYDTAGRCVLLLFPATDNFDADIRNLSPSIYFYKARTDDNIILSGSLIVSE